MKKIFQSLALLLLSVSTKSQNPVLTYTNVTGSNNITCSTPSVNVAASVSNYSAGLAFSWSNGTAVQTGSNVLLGSSGQYTLTAYNTASSFSLTQTFNIGTNTATPSSAISPMFQNIACLSAAQTVTAFGTPTINITHQFYSPGGVMATAASYTAIYVPGGPGTYTHCLINNTNGCSTCKTFTVQGSNFPTLTVTNPVANFTLGCGSFSNTTINLQGHTTPASNVPPSYTVIPGFVFGSAPGVGSSTTFAIHTPGYYTAIIRDNMTQCETSVPFSVFQGEAPALSYNVSTQTLTCITPSAVIQAANTGANITYQWQFAGGNATGNSYTANATANLSSTVTGNFTLTATSSSNGCSTSSVITLYQNRFFPNVSIPGTHVINCATPSVALSFNASSSIPAAFSATMPVVNVLWQGPSPQPTLGTSPNYTANTPGVYSVTVIDLNNGCESNTTVAVSDGHIYPVLSPSVPAPFSCPNPTVAIYPSILGSAASNNYFWISPANAIVSGVNSFSLITDSPGLYKVILTNIASGCATSTELLVSTCTGIGSNSVSNNNILLFPNPNNGLLTVTISKVQANTSIEIYNTFGALIKKQAINSEETIIDLKNEPNGIYLVYVLDKNKTVSVSKIVKQ